MSGLNKINHRKLKPDKIKPNKIIHGDAKSLLNNIETGSISLSVWSPPYFVGKKYEEDLSYNDWKTLLATVIQKHKRILKPGGFLAINIADILCYQDKNMPSVMADNISRKKVDLSRDTILQIRDKHPNWNRDRLAEHFKCSEQTIDRRLNGNNMRGGKKKSQTRIDIVGGFVSEMAQKSGLYMYDRRLWVKDPAWVNSKWHTMSYSAIDEFEYVYVFWKPGITKINKSKLSKTEWADWGSRGVWYIPSVRSNSDHDSKFPVELASKIIKIFSEKGDTVLDCFVGSGTTAVACIVNKRNFIGIDKTADSVKLSKKNVKNIIKILGKAQTTDVKIQLKKLGVYT